MESDVLAPCPGQSCDYSEGLFVGYRGLTSRAVAYPFGHGLSYTKFDYSWVDYPDRQCNDTDHVICFSFKLSNVGNRQGAEVAQVYVAFPSSAQEPPTQLRAFKKVEVDAGAGAQVSIGLTERDLSIWDVSSKSWQVKTGLFSVLIGSSSRDIRLRGQFNITQEY